MTNKLYTAQEFYQHLKDTENIDLDFIIDFDGIKTIKEWLLYVIETLEDLNDDLLKIDPKDDAIFNNRMTINDLRLIYELN